MRYLTADLLFDGYKFYANAVLIVADSGRVEAFEIQPPEELLKKVERFEGILSPGFVNVHCHLELSHLYGKLAEKTGLPKFIRQIPEVREVDEETILTAIAQADKSMFEKGISGCGDISNTNHSFLQKIKSPIQYHTFIEVFGSHPDVAENVFERAKKLEYAYRELFFENNKQPKVSITPHAPYSISKPLLKKLAYQCDLGEGIMSLHNQETASENELFLSGTGELSDVLKSFGLSMEWWQPTGFNSLPSFLSHFGKCQKNILVHNTFTSAEDVAWVYRYSPENYWCFCPNANLYIEGRLPDISCFDGYDDKCVLGTDSLASNWQLDIMAEINTLLDYTKLPLERLLKWATSNGAKALNFNALGSFETGKCPGVVQILKRNGKYVSKRVL